MDSLEVALVDVAGLESDSGIHLSCALDELSKRVSTTISPRLACDLYRCTSTWENVTVGWENATTLDELLERMNQRDNRVPRLAAAPKACKAALGFLDAGMVIQEQPMMLLRKIACAGSVGILQSELASVAAMEAKNVFHHNKILRAVGLVKSQPVIVQTSGLFKALRTNMLALSRFTSASMFEECALNDAQPCADVPEGVASAAKINELSLEVLRLLKKEPGEMMAESDCMEVSVGSSQSSKESESWDLIRRQLITEGRIQGTSIKSDTNDKAITYMRLLHPSCTGAQVAVLEYAYRVIERSGPAGIFPVQVTSALQIEKKVVNELVKQIIQSFGVEVVAEQAGKSSYRLVAPSSTSMLRSDRSELQGELRSECVAVLSWNSLADAEDFDASWKSGSREEQDYIARNQHNEHTFDTAGCRDVALWRCKRTWDGQICGQAWLARIDQRCKGLGRCPICVRKEHAGMISRSDRLGPDPHRHESWNTVPLQHLLGRSNRVMTALRTRKVLPAGLLRKTFRKVDLCQGFESFKGAVDGSEDFNLTRLLEATGSISWSSVSLPDTISEDVDVMMLARLSASGLQNLAAPSEITESPSIHSHNIQENTAQSNNMDVSNAAKYLNGLGTSKGSRLYTLHVFLLQHLGQFPCSLQHAPSSPRTCIDIQNRSVGCEGAAGGEKSMSIPEIIQSMPLIVYLQVIGCTSRIPGLDQLLALNPSVSMLEPVVKEILLDKTHVEMELSLLLKTLVNVGLLLSRFTAQNLEGCTSEHFMVIQNVALDVSESVSFDTRGQQGATQVNFRLCDSRHVDEFWEEFSSRCLQNVKVGLKRKHDSMEPAVGELPQIPLDFYNRKFWTSCTRSASVGMIKIAEELRRLADGRDAQGRELSSSVPDQGLEHVLPGTLVYSPDASNLVKILASKFNLSRYVTAGFLSSVPSVVPPIKSTYGEEAEEISEARSRRQKELVSGSVRGHGSVTRKRQRPWLDAFPRKIHAFDFHNRSISDRAGAHFDAYKQIMESCRNSLVKSDGMESGGRSAVLGPGDQHTVFLGGVLSKEHVSGILECMMAEKLAPETRLPD